MFWPFFSEVLSTAGTLKISISDVTTTDQHSLCSPLKTETALEAILMPLGKILKKAIPSKTTTLSYSIWPNKGTSPPRKQDWTFTAQMKWALASLDMATVSCVLSMNLLMKKIAAVHGGIHRDMGFLSTVKGSTC